MLFDFNESGKFIATPEAEGGVFVIDHEHYGRRAVDIIDVSPTPEQIATYTGEDDDGELDLTSLHELVSEPRERPGWIGFTALSAHVTLSIPGSGNTVSVPVTEALEFAPAQF